MVSLTKNQTVSLSKASAALNPAAFSVSAGILFRKRKVFSVRCSAAVTTPLILDASCILLDKDGRILDTIWFPQTGNQTVNP